MLKATFISCVTTGLVGQFVSRVWSFYCGWWLVTWSGWYYIMLLRCRWRCWCWCGRLSQCHRPVSVSVSVSVWVSVSVSAWSRPARYNFPACGRVWLVSLAWRENSQAGPDQGDLGITPAFLTYWTVETGWPPLVLESDQDIMSTSQ